MSVAKNLLRTFGVLVVIFGLALACLSQSYFPTLAPPRFTSKSFLPWAGQYIDSAIDSVGYNRTLTKFFSPEGSDLLGDGSIDNPWQTISKASSYLASTSGDVRLRFRAGGIWRESDGLIVNKPNVTVDSYLKSTDPLSGPKPEFTRFYPPVDPTAWSVTDHSGTYSTPVQEAVAWVKYWNDEETVFRRMTTIEDCNATAGSWFANSTTLYVHPFVQDDLTTGILKVEWVPKNTATGILVTDVPNVRIHGIRVQGFGAGTPGDHSYSGYEIESDVCGSNRTVVTECESFYCGRHCMTKLGATSGGSLVVVRCRLGWIVNDDICLVGYSPLGGQELISAYNEFLGGQLPDSLVPYPNGAPDAPNYAHSSNDFVSKLGLFLCVANKIDQGPYMCGNISYTDCAPTYLDPIACRSFVFGEEAIARSLNAIDASKPNPTSNGHIFHRLGCVWTAFINCRISPTLLWTVNSGDIDLCSSASGDWINSEIKFDFSNVDLNSWERVLAVNSVQPDFAFFSANFYGCEIGFHGKGGGIMGFSGPMLHRSGPYYLSSSADWRGEMKGTNVKATGRGAGRFQVAFGNDSTHLYGNAYYGITDESGAWGCDQDTYRSIGTLASGPPKKNERLFVPNPILIKGYALEYDRNGSARPTKPTIGPWEPVAQPLVGTVISKK